MLETVKKDPLELRPQKEKGVIFFYQKTSHFSKYSKGYQGN